VFGANLGVSAPFPSSRPRSSRILSRLTPASPNDMFIGASLGWPQGADTAPRATPLHTYREILPCVTDNPGLGIRGHELTVRSTSICMRKTLECGGELRAGVFTQTEWHPYPSRSTSGRSRGLGEPFTKRFSGPIPRIITWGPLDTLNSSHRRQRFLYFLRPYALKDRALRTWPGINIFIPSQG